MTWSFRRRSEPPQGLALSGLQCPGIAERHPDRQKQYSASYRNCLGSQGRRKDRHPGFVRNVLRSSTARTLFPRRCLGRIDQRTTGFRRHGILFSAQVVPSNLNAIPIFQGNLINPASPHCAPSSFPQANTNLFYLPNQQQFQALKSPNSVFLNQNYLNLAGGPFCRLVFNHLVIRSPRTSSTPTRSKRT